MMADRPNREIYAASRNHCRFFGGMDTAVKVEPGATRSSFLSQFGASSFFTGEIRTAIERSGSPRGVEFMDLTAVDRS